jgi:2,3-bisphosphoglycerate-dependent phosphoglycerate mutase
MADPSHEEHVDFMEWVGGPFDPNWFDLGDAKSPCNGSADRAPNPVAYDRRMLDLVLLRHGQSTWNAKNLFTGWVDVDLTEAGEAEARAGGRLLAEEEGLDLRVLHTSVLTRAIRTAELALAAAGRSWLPVRRDWRLNERHYGDLQGKNKAEVMEEFGKEQLMLWRRSYATPPPPLSADNPWSESGDPRYRDLAPGDIPTTECLADVVTRVLPYWESAIVPDLRAEAERGGAVLVAAHGNSIRALRKHLEGISEDAITELEIPTGIPFRLQLTEDLTVHSAKFLGDPTAAAAAAAAVARQAG